MTKRLDARIIISDEETIKMIQEKRGNLKINEFLKEVITVAMPMVETKKITIKGESNE